MLVRVNVAVLVEVKVRVGEAVNVRVAVLVREAVVVFVGVLVEVNTLVTVGVMVDVAKVTEGVIEIVGVLISVPKTPMGMTVGAPVFIGWRVKIESLQAGGVRISWLMGSTTTRCCLT